MPKLKFVSLKCYRTEDTSGADEHPTDMTVEDEPYLLANHKRVWGVKRMKANQIEDLSDVKPISFTESISVELWEKDAGFFPDDDQIGRLTVQADKTAKGELTHEFKRKKAWYTMTYKVE